MRQYRYAEITFERFYVQMLHLQYMNIMVYTVYCKLLLEYAISAGFGRILQRRGNLSRP